VAAAGGWAIPAVDIREVAAEAQAAAAAHLHHHLRLRLLRTSLERLRAASA
jgi:hypothetical protein